MGARVEAIIVSGQVKEAWDRIFWWHHRSKGQQTPVEEGTELDVVRGGRTLHVTASRVTARDPPSTAVGNGRRCVRGTGYYGII